MKKANAVPFPPVRVTAGSLADSRLQVVQKVEDLFPAIKEAVLQRDLLADAIGKAAIKSGIYRPDLEGMTGPQLLMAVDEMAECILSQADKPAQTDYNLAAPSPAVPGIDVAELRSIASDLSHAAKVSDYELQQIEFIESIRDRLLVLIESSPKDGSNAQPAKDDDDDNWRDAAFAACSHLDYPTDAPKAVSEALRELRSALYAPSTKTDGSVVCDACAARTSTGSDADGNEWCDTCAAQARADHLPDADPVAAARDRIVAAATAWFREDTGRGYSTSEDAPGHGHKVPGHWDADGTPCARCALWKELGESIAAMAGEVQP